MSSSPSVILISGLSCSGKSTLAENLAGALEGEMIRVDDYYFETDPADFGTTDFDDPAMIDVPLLAAHLRQLKSGRPTQSPHYDFELCRYTRRRTIQPKPYLIVEGQYAAVYGELLALADLTVYLDVPVETCLARRLTRDQTILHRALVDSESRFQTKVAPAFECRRAQIVENSSLVLADAPQAQWLAQVIDATRVRSLSPSS